MERAASKHGPIPPKPPYTPEQLVCGQLVKLSPVTFDRGCVKTFFSATGTQNRTENRASTRNPHLRADKFQT